MRFVENNGGIVGQEARELHLAQAEVGKEKMMIDDEDVGFRRALVHQSDEAALELRALLAGAGLAARVDARPELARIPQIVEFGAVAALRVCFPLADLRVHVDFFHAGENGLLFDVVEFLPAEVVLAALHERDAHFGKKFFQEGNVFEKNLLLKIFRSRRDDDALPEAQDWHEISQRLAGPRARFNDEMLPVFE